MKRRYIEKKIGGLKTIVFPGDPEKGTIVLLHGFGADCFDLVSLSEVYEGPTWVFPQGPLEIPFSPSYIGRAWFPVNIELLSGAVQENRFEEIGQAFPSHINDARTLIQTFLADLNVPASQLTLGGFSQGAILTLEVALNARENYCSLLIFSGTYIDQFNWKTQAHNHAKTPFFQSHGMQDSLLPINKAQELEKILIEGGLQGKLHTFQGGHEIPHSILMKLSTFLKALRVDSI